MRFLTVLMACCAVSVSAAAQNSMGLRDTVPDYNLDRVATILSAAGVEHSMQSLSDGRQYITVRYNGSNFIIQNQCFDSGCAGLRLFATIGRPNDFSLNYANSLNASRVYYKVFLDGNNVLALERYRIGDFGDFTGNILVEVREFSGVIQNVAQNKVSVSAQADNAAQQTGKLANAAAGDEETAHVAIAADAGDGNLTLFAGNALN